MILAKPPISPCHFFQFQSHFVWDRIAFARKMNLRISETSITEELLYHFYQYFESFRVPFRLFESLDERRNGSDLEIMIKTSDGFILLACQAKITYKSGKYKAFHHEVGGARQIDLLQTYARRHGGVAQYLFYNFIPEPMMSTEVNKISEITDYGITHLAADNIIDWMNVYEKSKKKTPVPGFNTFHPTTASPLHLLICDLLRDDHAHLRLFSDATISALSYYDEADVSNAINWRRITSLARIGFIDDNVRNAQNEVDKSISQSKKRQHSSQMFKPKFRLVVGGAENEGALYSIE